MTDHVTTTDRIATVIATGPLQTESRRARVRRLLFDPMGFRRSGKVSPEAHAAALDALADELGYMADDRLDAMRAMLASKGEGKARDLWPSVATVRAFAEIVQPRPLTELPALVRWFRSVEGPRARAEGTLVATWQYFEARKVPPVKDGARRMVAERAARQNRRVLAVADRRRLGLPVAAEDAEYVRWYLDLVSQLEALLGEVVGPNDGSGAA